MNREKVLQQELRPANKKFTKTSKKRSASLNMASLVKKINALIRNNAYKLIVICRQASAVLNTSTQCKEQLDRTNLCKCRCKYLCAHCSAKIYSLRKTLCRYLRFTVEEFNSFHYVDMRVQ